MAIELTSEQLRQVDAAAGKPTEVIDSRGGRRYVLLTADQYDVLRDEIDQSALRQTSLRNLASRLEVDD